LSARRVVITGLGAVTPLGIGVEEVWSALCRGESGVGPITRFDTSGFDVRIAAEVKDFDPQNYIPKKDVKKMDTFIQYALAASIMAVEDAELKVDEAEAERVGVLVGAGIGGLPAIEKYHKVVLTEGPHRITPFFIPMLIVNLASGQISIRFGFKGPNYSVVTACASGNHSIGEAYRCIQREEAEVMLAGGTESVITPLAVGGFSAMKALSTRNDDPTRASRPFDKQRDGFVIGEGAGVLILEELGHALNRGAKIYAEIVGFGMSGDAYHISSPDPTGDGAKRCMLNCLKDAALTPEEVDYINAHGTSTLFGDKHETTAIKAVFGEHARRLKVSSTKSMVGHLLGAAGGVEAVVCVLSIARGIITPTINYEYPDPDCDLDYVPNQAIESPVRVALSNSFGFGGTNASLLFKRFEE
jgi:3-oxoacyl-[acyl-carrier-protein] synthase II